MKVLIFGATGMVGQGVLRECPLNPDTQIIHVAKHGASKNILESRDIKGYSRPSQT